VRTGTHALVVAAELVAEAVAQAREQAAAAGEHDILQQLLAQVRVERGQRRAQQHRHRLRQLRAARLRGGVSRGDCAGKQSKATHGDARQVREEALAEPEALRAVERVVPVRELVLPRRPARGHPVGARVSRAAARRRRRGTDCSLKPCPSTPPMLCSHSSTSRSSAHFVHESVVSAMRSSRSAYCGGSVGSTG
jgi:hypothetical protein